MRTEPTKAEPPKRKLHRFQFRLRTLMIAVSLAAVPCAYVAHEAKIVRARNAWLSSNRPVLPEALYLTREVLGNQEKGPSWIRVWLGDKSYREIWAQPEAMQDAAKLFPEARIFEVHFGDRPADGEQN